MFCGGIAAEYEYEYCESIATPDCARTPNCVMARYRADGYPSPAMMVRPPLDLTPLNAPPAAACA